MHHAIPTGYAPCPDTPCGFHRIKRPAAGRRAGLDAFLNARRILKSQDTAAAGGTRAAIRPRNPDSFHRPVSKWLYAQQKLPQTDRPALAAEAARQSGCAAAIQGPDGWLVKPPRDRTPHPQTSGLADLSA
jgi:hypothetical protein